MNIATIQAVSLILLIMVPVMIKWAMDLQIITIPTKVLLLSLLKKVKRKSSGNEFALMEEILVNLEIVCEKNLISEKKNSGWTQKAILSLIYNHHRKYCHCHKIVIINAIIFIINRTVIVIREL